MATGSKQKGSRGPVQTKDGARASDRYLDRVRLCPLRILRTEQEYDLAIQPLNDLGDRGSECTPDETEYLLALALFVAKDEDEHEPIPGASGAEMLRALIEARQIPQKDVATGTGLSHSTISEILAGTRKLHLKPIELLARFFQVKPAFFLDA